MEREQKYHRAKAQQGGVAPVEAAACIEHVVSESSTPPMFSPCGHAAGLVSMSSSAAVSSDPAWPHADAQCLQDLSRPS